MQIAKSVTVCAVVLALTGCRDELTGPAVEPRSAADASAHVDSAQGCVSDGICELEGIEAPAPEKEVECGALGYGCGDGDGGDGGSDGSGDGAGGLVADDEEVDCEDVGCKLRDPTPSEREKIMSLISRIRSDGFCGQIRSSATQMVNRKVQVWDNEVLVLNENGQKVELLAEAPWDYETGGPIMYLWTESLTSWTIAHEAIHGIWNPNGVGHYYVHTDTTPLGMSFEETAKYCSLS